MRIRYLNENEILTEGTKYDKKAAKILSDSGLFNEETSQNIIDALFRQDIHAFVHAPAWLEKYLIGIARIIVDEADGDPSKAKSFLEECPPIFDRFLTWVKGYRPKLSDKEKLKLDGMFNETASYEGVKAVLDKIQAKRDEKSKKELANMKFGESSYRLVPIESYEDFHEKYGGRLTGDGSSNKAAGRGGTAWCHTNDEGTYDSWVKGGKRFFVLEKNDWKNIPFNPKTNRENVGKDDYGTSLIAILVNRRGILEASTLRCNHIGVPNNADNQYETYAELSKLAGFNVEEEVMKYIGDVEDIDVSKCLKVTSGTLYWDEGYAESIGVEKSELTEYTIPDGVTRIEAETFEFCSNLPSIVIPDSVTIIGGDAFFGCIKLASVTIGNNVKTIGSWAFFNCPKLTSVDIPNTVTSIGSYAFSDCTGLTSITIPNSVTQIGYDAFCSCDNLTVHCERESYAERYCLGNNIAIEYTNGVRESLTERKESIVENYKDNVLITSTDQMLDGMMGNASDKDIDDTIRLVNAIKRFWHHPTDYEPLVAIVDSEYDPSVFQDSLKAEKQPLSNTRYKDIDVYFIDRKDGDKGAGIRFAREEKNGKVYLYFHDAVSLEDYLGRIDRMYDEFDDSYEEETEDEYTEVATKSVRDSDGMMTDYTWYRRNSDGLNIFMFGDKDVYTPDAEYADWETESDEQAEEWFDNYDGFEEDFDEEDDFSTTFEADDDYEEEDL